MIFFFKLILFVLYSTRSHECADINKDECSIHFIQGTQQGSEMLFKQDRETLKFITETHIFSFKPVLHCSETHSLSFKGIIGHFGKMLFVLYPTITSKAHQLK